MLEATKRTPKVLFIRNVFLHDCIEVGQSIESKLLEMNISSNHDDFNTSKSFTYAPVIGTGLSYESGSTNSMIEHSLPHNMQGLSGMQGLPKVNSAQSLSGNLLDLSECSEKDYQKLPRVFESLETWPKSTNLHCWYCMNQFTGIPKFIPLVVEPNIHSKYEDKYLIEVEATCCRWPCCISYIYETTKDLTKAIEKINNLYFLYKIFTGTYPTYIPAAPSKYMQVHFGGDISPSQYYKLYGELEAQHGI